jgi:hypothetical protein
MNLCSDCEKDFANIEAFDAHRIGLHAYTFDAGLQLEPPRRDGRRCLGAEELSLKGWTTDGKGRWVHPRELRKRARRGGDALTEPASNPDGHSRSSEAPKDSQRAITGSRRHARRPVHVKRRPA